MANYGWLYGLIATYGCASGGAAWFAYARNKAAANDAGDAMRNHFGAGRGLGGVALFFTLSASLFSAYSVEGIAWEAWFKGWFATRWIPAGVGVYMAFLVLAPRLHALGKARGYLTLSEVVYDRFSAPNSRSQLTAHALRVITWGCLLLPIFTYQISQFVSMGKIVEAFTAGAIGETGGILIFALIMIVVEVVGGLRAVAYTDVIQGVMLIAGSLIFFIASGVEFGGLKRAKEYFVEIDKFQKIPKTDGSWSIISYTSFTLRVAVAATMFPHLAMRLFVAKDRKMLQRGLAGMNFTFFWVQLSTMIAGWTAVYALRGQTGLADIVNQQSIFGKLALQLKNASAFGDFAASLLVLAAFAAMISTADSGLLAFSTMFIRDIYEPYAQKIFGPKAPVDPSALRVVGLISSLSALAIGLSLSILNIREGKPDITGLFSIQTVTPIHAIPAVWGGLHLHWLSGEAVLAGMVAGIVSGLAFVLDTGFNVKRNLGLDEHSSGWNTCVFAFLINIGVVLAYTMVERFVLAPSAASPVVEKNSESKGGRGRPLFIGKKVDKMLSNPIPWFFMMLTLLAACPFWYGPDSKVKYVGSMATWAFTSLFFSFVLAMEVSLMYIFRWEDFELPEENEDAPTKGAAGKV
ncbi:Sodium/solute symporter [Ostreococcus tauri]|uniref:Sodium/solute symporter n=1 Tax=Ostreococcus tauri TaxID=70448 RepID=A0A090MCK5_OSTTA|nr:Sodium/solute symporter [Ostreococcus tauri]CEF99819.1 Sodium/solute symporter [Ostreococcus tauri]|eukprot:XP_022840052.1 Sodium/solute symporter [Ostreococcus tauri]